jgi:tryptophan synthase alpha chain
MSSIDIRFRELRSQGRKAFIPFITGGDPNLEFTKRLLQRLDSLGCTIGEVGIPYSDPIADGPVIQASYQRALDNKVKLDGIFSAVTDVAPKLSMPLVTMVSYSIIHKRGPERYIADAQAAGFAGAIVPDLLVEESHSLSAICKKAGFSLIQLVTPTTTNDRAIRIAELSSGFIYFVSITGITGERATLPANLVERVQWLRERTELPICIGFGISKPEHVRTLAPVADGVIVGSAIVRSLKDAGTDESKAMKQVEDLVKEMIGAVKETSLQPS